MADFDKRAEGRELGMSNAEMDEVEDIMGKPCPNCGSFNVHPEKGNVECGMCGHKFQR